MIRTASYPSLEARVAFVTGGGHVGGDRLGREELMAQVHGEPIVPVLRRHALDRVALVVGGVVDQYPDRPQAGPDVGDRRPERRDVAQVARNERRRRMPRPSMVFTRVSETVRSMSTNATRAR